MDIICNCTSHMLMIGQAILLDYSHESDYNLIKSE